MEEKHNNINRRNFLKTIGATGLGSVLASAQAMTDANKPKVIEPNAKERTQKPKLPQVPKRKLGKTGVEVSSLMLGGGFNLVENQIILSKALEWGIDCWDTTPAYAGRNSELGIGKFLSKNPKVRKKVFIVTKASGTKTIEDIENQLQKSLESIGTNYIDLYYGRYMLSEPEQLNEELKRWVESAKKRKLIRFFGSSTHKNMDKCLTAAAKLGWIDAIMTSYNFRLMQDAKMQAAVDACRKAGVGLIAMKTQSKTIEADEDRKLTEHFFKRGFTEGQAKIKAVLEDERISSACVKMQNVNLLTSNALATLDKTKLSQTDLKVLSDYAKASCSGYCTGCASICDGVLPDVPYISEIMRYLMYHNSYGEKDRAKKLFAKIPHNARNKLLSVDYRLAESICPQHMPISKLVVEAVNKLA